MKKRKCFKGQELVEFALILPVMLVILVAIAEMGFMWTLRGTVSDAVKSSVQQMQLIAGMDQTTASSTLRTNIETYLANHGVPNASSVQVTLDSIGENTTVNVTYEYNPTFTLPNFFGIQLLPDTMKMGSSQVINTAIFGPNNYAGGGDTSLPLSVDPNSPTSVLIDNDTDTRNTMTFLINLPGNIDKLVNWWGHDIMTANTGINASTGTIWMRGAECGAAGWCDTSQSYADLLLANGYTNVIYADGSAGLNIDNIQMGAPANVYDGELGGLSWCTPNSADPGNNTCDDDITSNAASSSLLATSIYNVGRGYEVLPPVPTASAADAVTLPSGDLVADRTNRNVSYQDTNIEKLRFYVPKTVDGATFTPPTSGATLADTPDNVLLQTIDTDGDGIANAFDTYPNDADADRNRTIDGYQSTAYGAVQPNINDRRYPASGWGPIGGKTGDVPIYNGMTVNTINSASQISNNLDTLPGTPIYVTPQDTSYAKASCTDDGSNVDADCNDSTKPFFLKVTGEYTTTSGQDIRISQTGTGVVPAEKYRSPDPNRKVFQVSVYCRDYDKDGTFEPASGMVVAVDDDAPVGGLPGDGDNDKDDAWIYGAGGVNTTGLMFVDGNTGRPNFNAPLNMGYPSYDPTTDLDNPKAGTKYTP
ncbi:MAG: TadE family protein [Cyanobacteriota bacterium]